MRRLFLYPPQINYCQSVSFSYDYFMPDSTNPYTVGVSALKATELTDQVASDSPYGPAKDSRGVMKIAQAGLIFSALTSFFSIGFSGKAWMAYNTGESDFLFWNSDGSESSYTEYWEILNITVVISYIVSLVLFQFWNNRSVKNSWALSENKQFPEISPGWAVGFYFIPVVSLWKPFQIMKDTWKRCAPENHVSPLIHLWWTLWIASTSSSQIASRLLDSETADYGTAMAWSIGDDIILIISSLILIFIIRTITARQLDQIQNSTLVDSVVEISVANG
ncbi:MAG: hypothetical protein ACI9FG_000915 [Crocinitomicaceae bacterium]|jgi:hypothetical protein